MFSFLLLRVPPLFLLLGELQQFVSADFLVDHGPEGQCESGIVLSESLDVFYGWPQVHRLKLFQLYFKHASNFCEHFLRRIAPPKFNVRDERRRAIELLRKFPKRDIELISTAAHEWSEAFHGCQLI